MPNILVCVGLGEERSVFLGAAERPRRTRRQYNFRISLAPMHPFRQGKTVNCAGHVYVRKQHIYRDTIQDADRLSAIRCLNNVEARVAHVARRYQTQKNVVFYDQYNWHGRRMR